MKMKIAGIFICTLLIIATGLPVTGNVNIVSITNNQVFSGDHKSVEIPFFNGQIPKDKMCGRTAELLSRGLSDCAIEVQQTTDGGYIIIGFTETYSTGIRDVWLIKTDSNGNEQWNKTWGRTDSDIAQAGLQTNDGGFVLAGQGRWPSTWDADFWLIKTYNNGNEQWNKRYGISVLDETAFSVQQTSDGGYTMAGNAASYGNEDIDVMVIKTDSNGNEVWSKTFGGEDRDRGWSLKQTADGGFIVVGVTESYGNANDDVWLIKIDSNGNEGWNKILGGSSDDSGHDILLTSDGGYIILGSTSSNGDNDNDFWLIKTDSNGDKQWDKTWSGADSNWYIETLGYSGGLSIKKTSDNGYILTGITDAYGASSNDALLIKTDSNGNEQWKKIFGGSGIDEAYCVNSASDGGYIIGGATESFGTSNIDGWLIKTDSSGNEQWNKTFPANQPPNPPSNPDPEDGETDVKINVDLSWSGDDPDGDNVTFDVYFGTTSPPPKVVSKQSETTYDPGLLDFDTEYFWQIVAWDIPGGLSTSGSIWSFTTEENIAPYTPSNPDPPDGATDVSIEKILKWNGGDPNPGDTVTYDVYFGKSSPPPLVDEDILITSYDQGTMDLATTYYWQIVAEDSQGASSSSSIWHFTTELEPNQAPTKPEIYGSSNGPPGKELSWAFISDDADDNQVKYIIEWGDETSDETDYYQDNTLVEVSHTYEEEGDYTIKAKAVDEKGLESQESTFSVKIQKSRTVYHLLLLRIFERFANLFPILEKLLSFIRVI